MKESVIYRPFTLIGLGGLLLFTVEESSEGGVAARRGAQTLRSKTSASQSSGIPRLPTPSEARGTRSNTQASQEVKQTKRRHVSLIDGT